MPSTVFLPGQCLPTTAARASTASPTGFTRRRPLRSATSPVYFARRRHHHRCCCRFPPTLANFAIGCLPTQPASPSRPPLSLARFSIGSLPPRPAAASLSRPVLPSTAFLTCCDVDCLHGQLFTSISSPSMLAERPPATPQGWVFLTPRSPPATPHLPPAAPLPPRSALPSTAPPGNFAVD